MKKIINLVFILLVAITVNAQRKVEKFVKISKNQELFVDFKFAQNIEVKQWDQNKIEVRATVNLNNGEGDKHFSLKTSENGNQVKIYSDFGNYFKRKRNWDQHNTTEINYVVYVPKNATLKVKSISGSLEADSYNGNLTTDLISGNITIKNYNGEMQLKTVSGDVDVAVSKAKINAKTVTGTIYSDLKIDSEFSENKSYSSKIRGTVNNGDIELKMITVSGNIYLRKIK
jgi:hypothetical protein